jgi:hypothetical protein
MKKEFIRTALRYVKTHVFKIAESFDEILTTQLGIEEESPLEDLGTSILALIVIILAMIIVLILKFALSRNDKAREKLAKVEQKLFYNSVLRAGV